MWSPIHMPPLLPPHPHWLCSSGSGGSNLGLITEHAHSNSPLPPLDSQLPTRHQVLLNYHSEEKQIWFAGEGKEWKAGLCTGHYQVLRYGERETSRPAAYPPLSLICLQPAPPPKAPAGSSLTQPRKQMLAEERHWLRGDVSVRSQRITQEERSIPAYRRMDTGWPSGTGV